MTNIVNSNEYWSNIDQIKKTFAPTLTEMEFGLFLTMGKSLGANPFNREIWAVKYGSGAAQIFCGRDFYRRKAQEQPDYTGHQVDAVYENDEFKMVNGKPNHSYQIANRGKLVGAYCIVFVKNREPFFTFAEMSEYNSGQSNWKTKPATMIKKVAEAQALRSAFQGVFQGTYEESEQGSFEVVVEENDDSEMIERINELLKSELFKDEEKRQIEASVAKANSYAKLSAIYERLYNELNKRSAENVQV
jgi:phage recombination protein Bet